MRKIKTPGGGPTVVHTGTDEEADKLEALLEQRFRFVIAYCKEKGWPSGATELTIPQILEIRKQPGWQSPGSRETKITVGANGAEASLEKKGI